MTEHIRVLVVDDQPLVREGIASLLALAEGLAVVGTAADGAQALALAEQTRPDVVLMDVRMPTVDGVTAAQAMRRLLPSARVLMLTTFDDEQYVLDSLRAGAAGYLLKDLPAAELAQAVRLAHAGVDQHNPAVVGRLLAALDRAGAPEPTPPEVPLTPREQDVLRLIAGGREQPGDRASALLERGDREEPRIEYPHPTRSPRPHPGGPLRPGPPPRVKMDPMLVTIEDIRAAAGVIDGVVVHTPLLATPARPGLLVKPECLQPTGAFKLRGAVNAVAALSSPAGVITHSSGNHGQALAYAARRAGIPCVVVMPEESRPVKVEAVRLLGAELELVPVAQRAARTAELAAARGLAFVPPYDHPDVIAGQGTVGLEIVTSRPEIAAVLVPVGGGGLASGVATAVKALAPGTPVIGVEPALAADAAESLQAGALVTWPVEQTVRTVADGLRTALSPLTFAHLSARLDGIVTVTEEEILSTVGSLAREYRIVAEPSGAVAAAAWLHHAASLRARFGIGDGAVVAIVSGGNA